MTTAYELLKYVQASGCLAPEEYESLRYEIAAYFGNSETRQIIIAGSAHQAVSIAKLKGCKKFIYVANPEQLKALPHRQTVWFYGTYYNLPAWSELYALVKALGHTDVEVRYE